MTSGVIGLLASGGLLVKVFVSYRRADAAAWAGRLGDTLAERFGARHVFFDIVSIDVGDRFGERIRSVIASCDVALVVIGPEWVEVRDPAGHRRLDDPADWVRTEVATALEGGIVILPVLVGGASMPSAAVVPPELEPLTELHAVRLRDETWRSDSAALVRAIERLVKRAPHRRRRRTLVRLGVVIGVLITVVVALFVVDRTVFAPSNAPVGLVEALWVEATPDDAAPAVAEDQLTRDLGDRVRIRFFVEDGDSATASLFVDDVPVVQDLQVDWTMDDADDQPDRGFVELTATPFRFGTMIRLVVSDCESTSDPASCFVVAQLESDL